LNSNQFGNLRNREVGNSRVILLKESKSETTNSLFTQIHYSKISGRTIVTVNSTREIVVCDCDCDRRTHAAFGCCAGQSPGDLKKKFDFPSSDPFSVCLSCKVSFGSSCPCEVFLVTCPSSSSPVLHRYLQAARVVCSEAKVWCRRGME
jgi:hypothetical protein